MAQRSRGLAESTIRHRGKQVRRYLRHVGAARVWTADHHDVESWLATRELGTSALQRAISDVSVFYRWARREELTTVAPSSLLERPRRKRAVPRPVPDGVVLRALRQPDPRLAAAVALMAYGGLRCCEVSRATVGDIDRTAEAIYVTGKGGHTRWVPIVAPLVPYLSRLHGLEPSDPIVPRQDGLPGPASAARISQRVSAWLRECAGGQPWTAHQLRHWYAGQALERTGRLDLVQLLLGHQSIATTQVYAAVPASWAHHLRDVWPD
jgi:site-specific recombinase XerD